ncbi:hypothetical protein GmHk_20G057471 [Glycine max]|nr:hypothetical protein GmHk_20G057471 [Glycine max]
MSRKTISLYDITANDNPGSLLMQVQLKGKNFDEWACSLRSALKNLWEELGNHVQIPAFTCGGCTCNLASKLEKKLEEEKIHQFLMGLDKTVYGTVRSNMLAQDPLPKRPHGRGKAEKGRTYGARGCGAVSKANATQASTSEPKPNIVITDADKSAVSGLDAEQWQTLVNLLNDVKIGLVEKLTGKRNLEQWIIETGASRHIIGKIECLTDVTTILDYPVGLLDEKQMSATREGTMMLSDTLKLSNC